MNSAEAEGRVGGPAETTSTKVPHASSARLAKAEKNRKDVEFVLNNPVFLEVSEPIRKMRSNLMIVSVISIFSISMGLDVAPTSSIAGVQFTGLTQSKISAGLLLLTCYMFVHFVWSSWDGFQEWRIRCSGVGLAFTDIYSPGDADPRQLSLMTWWAAQAKDVGRQQESVRHNLELFEKAIAPLDADPTARDHQDQKARHEMTQNFMAYSSGMMQLYKMGVSVPNENTLKVQLGRFELMFKRLLISQNWRWIFMEFLTPVALAVLAIFLLITELNLNPLFSFAII